MHFDETFFVFVALVIFLAFMVYRKVPVMFASHLDARADQIRDEIAEAKRLREEAEHLLSKYKNKYEEIEAEAHKIIAAAERKSEALAAEARQKTEDFISSRLLLLEKKVYQAELEAISSVYSAAADLILDASEEIITHRLDDNIKLKLFHNALAEINNHFKLT